MPRVEIAGLRKEYGPIAALDGVDLRIGDQEYVSIIGPSGCGKTTLIKCIAGIMEPTRGEIYIDGKDVGGLRPEERGVGYVFQDIALFPQMNVWDNVTYGPRVKGWDADRTRGIAREMLGMIGLQGRAGSYPNELSGGAGQKTAVARAVSSGSMLLLLDEPFGALDAKVRMDLRYKVKKLAKDLGLTAIHVTHDQEEAMSISDRVVVMRAGRVVEEGPPMQLYSEPKNAFTANFVGEANFLRGSVAGVSVDGALVDVGGYSISTGNAPSGIQEGMDVVVCVRPEFVSIEKGTNGAGLRGRIKEEVFQGSTVRYRVEIVGNTTISADYVEGLEPTGLDVGEGVGVKVRPENVLLYPLSIGDLAKEISLE
jgi:ABC-type Fe3+/spermidine/putrescine transport system ATPase subunit